MSHRTDIVVAVMGVTGTGKSSFIRLVTGDNKIKVGKRLRSGPFISRNHALNRLRTDHAHTIETNAISTYRLSYEGSNFVLVDTPGFDDTDAADESVLETITTWLTDTYREGKKLNGILYLHRIIDPRMQGTAQRNFSVFRRLCGPAFVKQIILGTTFWNALNPGQEGGAIGKRRLGELVAKEGYWGPMILGGSEAVMIPDDICGARQILLKFARMHPSVLQVQDEVVNQNLDPSTTSALKELSDQPLELEEAAIEREKRMTKDLHRLHLEMVELKKEGAEQKAAFEKKILALEQRLAQSNLEYERGLLEQATRFETDVLNRERARMAALAKQNEEHERRNRLALEHTRRDNACRLLINQFHMAQISGCVKCAVKPNGGKNIAECTHCKQIFKGFGMYSRCPPSSSI